MGSLLEIFTLGKLALRQDGEPLQLASRRAEALLVYLARCHSPQNRRHLAELFWPERSEEQALANLRTLLTRIRPQLGDRLAVSRDTIGLAEDSFRLDANTFELNLSSFKLENRLAALDEAQAALLDEATGLYGGPFLNTSNLGASADFEDWAGQEREKLGQLAQNAFGRLADFYARRKDYPAAVNRLLRLLQIEPFEEKWHRLMLRLLAVQGQRSAALDHYTAYRQYLFRELDIAPEALTTDLYEAIRAGQPISPDEEEKPAARQGRTSPTLAQRTSQLSRVSLFQGTPPDLLAQLAELLQEEKRGPGEIIFEKGAPGNCMYIIIEGQVRIHDGNHTLNRLSGRDIFGEMAVLDASPRLASATTLTPTRLWRLDQATLYGLMERRIEVAQGIIRVLLGWLRQRVGEVMLLKTRLDTPGQERSQVE